MACPFSGKSEGVMNCTTERKPLQELVKSCRERLLPAIRRWLATDVKMCLSEARFRLDNAQGTVDNCAVNQKRKQEEREPKPNSNKRMRMGKGKRVDAVRSIYVTAGMADEFRQLALNDPFRCLDMEDFHSLTENLKQVIEELQNRKGEINVSLRSIKQSLNAWNALLTAVSIGVQVCSLLLLVLGASPVTVDAGTTAGTVIKTALEEWIGSIWERRKGTLKEEKQAVEIMQAQLQVSLYDHQQSIESLVQMVKSGYDALAVELQLLAIHQHDEEEALKKRLKEMMAKFNGGELKAAIISLENKVDECDKKIRAAEEALRSINIS